MNIAGNTTFDYNVAVPLHFERRTEETPRCNVLTDALIIKIFIKNFTMYFVDEV